MLCYEITRNSIVQLKKIKTRYMYRDGITCVDFLCSVLLAHCHTYIRTYYFHDFLWHCHPYIVWNMYVSVYTKYFRTFLHPLGLTFEPNAGSGHILSCPSIHQKYVWCHNHDHFLLHLGLNLHLLLILKVKFYQLKFASQHSPNIYFSRNIVSKATMNWSLYAFPSPLRTEFGTHCRCWGSGQILSP